jgi:hypothetical protein
MIRTYLNLIPGQTNPNSQDFFAASGYVTVDEEKRYSVAGEAVKWNVFVEALAKLRTATECPLDREITGVVAAGHVGEQTQVAP